MYEDFSIYQRSTRRPRKQPSKLTESTTKSKEIRTIFNKERNVVAHACTEKEKKHCNILTFKFERL